MIFRDHKSYKAETYTFIYKMAAVCGGVILEVSPNNHRTSVKSKTFNTSSRKKKGCFGWLRFWKRKKVSTIQTHNIK